jgi:hypothetical protein
VLAAIVYSLLRLVSVLFLSPFHHTTASHLTPVYIAMAVKAHQHSTKAFQQMDVFQTPMAPSHLFFCTNSNISYTREYTKIQATD